MADRHRIEDLRRRVQQDPTSIAFAQLAEELRRAGEMPEAVEICRAGLRVHPDYVSARVTHGRALIALNQLDEAQAELERVLRSAPENLAAIRGLADVHRRRGNTAEALARYRAALSLAQNDPELQEIVARLSRDVEADSRGNAKAAEAAREFSEAGKPDVPGASGAAQPLPLNPERERAVRMVAALEQFLGAIRSRARVHE